MSLSGRFSEEREWRMYVLDRCEGKRGRKDPVAAIAARLGAFRCCSREAALHTWLVSLMRGSLNSAHMLVCLCARPLRQVPTPFLPYEKRCNVASDKMIVRFDRQTRV